MKSPIQSLFPRISLARLLAVSFLSLASIASAAKLTVNFQGPEEGQAPYKEVNVYVINTATARSFDDAITFRSTEKTFSKTFENLKPGMHVVLSFTGSFEQVQDASRPGAFLAQDQVIVSDDSAEETLTVQYKPLDASEWTGTASAKGKVFDGSGQPLRGVELGATAVIQTAGNLVISKATTGDDGSFQFDNLAEDKTYAVTDAEGSPVGEIKAGDEIALSMPPQAGQAAPDFSFVHLDGDEEKRLTDLKDKIVLLEFWASWCGPCQAPMAKMQTYREKYPHWGEKVELLTLSIDDEKKSAVDHLKKNGWNSTSNAWAGEGGFAAEAPKAYVVQGIPTAFLIGPDGKIVKSGHPMAVDFPELINELLANK